ncbi:MAG: OmpA family protein [Granulosicoccus sp.]|nr:OmpA family protein [Granulosicoccus sp.]
MKKLLVLALLGLGLGAGAWKAQNPEGTVEDFRAQANVVVERLKAGALAVRETSPDSLRARADTAQALEASIDERLEQIEQTLSLRESENLQPLAARVADLGTSLERLDNSLADVVASNEANVLRLDTIDSRLELLVRRLDEQTVEQNLGELQESIETLENEISSLQQRADASETSVDNQLTTVAEQAAAMGLRLDTLAVARTATAGGTDGPTGEEGADQDSETSESGSPDVDGTADLASLTAGLDERFTAIESRLSTVNSDSRNLEALTRQLESARTQINDLQQKNAAIRRNVQELNSTIEELKTAGESLSIDTVQAEIRDQLALVQSQFESDVAADNTPALESLLNNTRTQIEELEQRVQDLPASSSEATNALEIQTALESQIVALERRLEDINSADPELASTLSNVKERVDELASRGFVTQEDLRAQNEPQSVQYKIYFDRNSAEITEAAAKVLNSFITQEKNRTTGVSIFGFTDRRGPAIYNQQLALQRATNVRSYLIQNGLDYTKIKALTGLGEDAAAAVLPDNADDAQQRVVVLYAAQP